MKKRILSLILALSMVLSVLPLGAFAADPPELVMGANGLPVYSEGTVGHNWVYMNGTLCLLYGTFDFSSTHPQNTSAGTQTARPVACPIEIESDAEITGGIFEKAVTNNGGTIYDGTFNTMVENNVVSWGTLGKIVGGAFNGTVTNKGTISGGAFACSVENNGLISDGTFKGGVINYKTISGGTFQNTYSVENHGTISDGTFEGIVANNNTISGGTFQSTSNVTNDGTIKGNGIFAGIVTNNRFISGGTFQSTSNVINANDGTISDGTFAGRVINNSLISGGAFQNGCSVTNYGTINGNGTFNGEVSNNAATATIESGTFNGKVSNNQGGKITNGTFEQEVINNAGGTISNGTFEQEVINNDGGEISGGTFKGTVLNGNAIITGGTFAAGLSRNDGSVTGGVFNGHIEVEGFGVYHITVDEASPDAKIEKVNDVPVGASENWDPYVVIEGDALPEVTITASTEIYSLNGKSLSTNPYSSSQDSSDKTTVKFKMPKEGVTIGCGELVMENGYPVGTNNGTADCKGNGWKYTKGDTSNPKGKLTLKKSGKYDFSYTYPQNTSKGAGAEPVACAVETQLGVEITGGTFEGEVINNHLGEISGGTFHEKVSNYNGMIAGGTFKSSVTSTGNGRIFGGVFNSKTTPKPATDAYTITLNTANAKITEVNGVPAEWEPYVVVTEWTMRQEVTITASTDIFSLNGRLLGEEDHVNGNKKTVKFTMPKEKVVLNGAITCTDLVMKGGWPEASNNGTDKGTISCSGNGWSYDSSTKTLTLTSNSGTYDFSLANPQDTTKTTSADSAVACAIVIESGAEITGGTFEKKVTNNAGGIISSGTFQETCSVTNSGTIKNGTFKDVCSVTNNSTIENGTFAGSVTNSGTVTGGVFNGNATLINVTGGHNITWDAASPKAKIEKVNGVSADWAPYVVTSNATTKEVTITADTEIFSLNGQPIAESSYGVDKKTVTFTMPDDDVVLNRAITSTDLVMVNGYPKASNNGTIPCKGDGWQYIPNDPNFGNMLLLTGSNQTGGLFDFSTIGDGSAVECNVFVGKPTAITGGEFNGKVFNNSGILGGTFHGEVDNMGPGRIVNGTFKNSVENNGMIENGAFHDEVKNNGTINDGTFHGKVENNKVINSGTFHGEVVNTTMGRIENGTFNDAVENNGTIENGTFHGEVKNNGTINGGTFNGAVENNGTINGGVFNGAVTGSGTVSESITGSGTLNGELITKPEPEPEPKPEPKPEPEPTTYTVTVIGGTIDGKTSVSAKENDTLTVVLDQSEIPDGMTFDMWSISSSKLSGDINVDYRAEAMTFQMPAEDVTIRAQYRSAEIIEDAAPSPLATAATIAVGGAAAGIVVWQGVNLGVDLYLANALPQGVPVPTDRRALALLLWETAGKPEVALPTLYGDIPAEEIELQKATRWAIQNGLMDAADKKDASLFDPDHYVTKMDVFGAWLRLKKLLGTT